MIESSSGQYSAVAPRRGRPWLVGGLAASLLWAGTATYLVLFHDQAVHRILAGQMAMRTAYEARIAGLRERIDGATSERATAATALVSRLDTALARQAELERRQAALAGLVEAASAAPGTPALLREIPGRDPLPGFGLRPAEAAEPDPGRRSALDLGGGLPEGGLVRLEARLTGLEEAQGAALGRIAARAETGIARLRSVVLRAGLDPARLLPAAPSARLGGPYVALDAAALARQGFDGGVAAVSRLLGDGQRMRRLVGELPLRRPLPGEPAVSSVFGPRVDPFTRGLALHTGLDLRAEFGEAARATAPGVVTAAEWSGGYGNMVEIDHGHGLVTRFGHLARMAVRPGQRIAAGEVIGFVGSTGRSTGAHLHYETRIDGEPVDPQRFLDAGLALDGMRPVGG
jgi:murein DD-endopeptidase MepM/ murein hydrolase activator NlpD